MTDKSTESAIYTMHWVHCTKQVSNCCNNQTVQTYSTTNNTTGSYFIICPVECPQNTYPLIVPFERPYMAPMFDALPQLQNLLLVLHILRRDMKLCIFLEFLIFFLIVYQRAIYTPIPKLPWKIPNCILVSNCYWLFVMSNEINNVHMYIQLYNWVWGCWIIHLLWFSELSGSL